MKEKITINCHSSIRIEGEQVIYFDPFKIEKESHDADLIFITHDHYDHYDKDSIKKVMKETTKIVIPDKMATQVLGTFPSRNVVGVIPNESYEIEGILVETLPSYNVNKAFHPRNKDWVGYIITLGEERIYVAGDTDVTKENLDVSCDIALIPIGGVYTMTYQEGAELINKIKPKTVIPTHYGEIVGDLSDGEKFSKLLLLDIECFLLIK